MTKRVRCPRCGHSARLHEWTYYRDGRHPTSKCPRCDCYWPSTEKYGPPPEEGTSTDVDPLSPQWEDCKVCGGDHWTKDHPDLRLPPEKQEPMPPDRTPAAQAEGVRLERERIYMALVDRLWGCDADANAVLDIVENPEDTALDRLAVTKCPPVFGVDRAPSGHRWPDDPPPPVHQLLEGGYCSTCSGSCLIGFGNP
jgi:hypothetical protein